MSNLRTTNANVNASNRELVNDNEDDDDFECEGFRVEKYVTKKFVKMPVAEVKTDKKALIDQKTKVAEELKSNVFRNYPKFINSAKEIGNLETDLSDLRNLLGEVSSTMKSIGEFSFEGLTTSSLNRGNNLKQSTERTIQQNQLHKDLQYLLDLPLKLDIAINQRQYDRAVNSLLEPANKMFKENPQFDVLLAQTIKPEIERRVAQLSEQLINDLQNPTIKSSETRQIIILLRKLGLAHKARLVYLQTRSTRIEKEIKKLKMEGDLNQYINDLAFLVFSALNVTCEDFRSSFRDLDRKGNSTDGIQQMISGFIVWAIAELQKFGNIVKHQVFQNSDDFSAMGECLKIATSHCQIMEEKGLFLGNVVSQIFFPALLESINNYAHTIETNLSKYIAAEKWHSTRWIDPKNPQSSPLQLTESAKFLFVAAQDFVNNISHIITFELVPTACATISNIFDIYLIRLSEALALDLTDTQSLAIISNSYNCVEDLVPKVLNQLQSKLKRPVKEFTKVRTALHSAHERLQDLYCSKRADYTNEEIDDETTPSTKLVKMFIMLANLRTLVGQLVNQRIILPILTSIIEEIALRMDENKEFWDRHSINGRFGEGGLQQLILDMRFFLEAANETASQHAEDAINGIMDKAVLMYCKSSQKDTNVLKPDEWFTKRIFGTLNKFAKEMGIKGVVTSK